MEWPRPSSARSNVITSAAARDRMPRTCCVSCRHGSHTTTRFTRTRLSDIVHPVSSSKLTKDLDRVRSFGGYNKRRVGIRYQSPHLVSPKAEWHRYVTHYGTHIAEP